MTERAGIITATPNSFRQLKISEDGGGARITLDFDQGQYDQAYLLSLQSGKLIRFTWEVVGE